MQGSTDDFTEKAGDTTYAGFWVRFIASLLDALLLALVSYPILITVYGLDYFNGARTGLVAGPTDVLISWVLPPVAVIGFWILRQATPGKMLLGTRIVDADSGGPAPIARLVGRYFAYLVSAVFLGLGFLWVAFDRRKQGWHDKLAGTIVLRDPDPLDRVPR